MEEGVHCFFTETAPMAMAALVKTYSTIIKSPGSAKNVLLHETLPPTVKRNLNWVGF